MVHLVLVPSVHRYYKYDERSVSHLVYQPISLFAQLYLVAISEFTMKLRPRQPRGLKTLFQQLLENLTNGSV